MGKALKLLCVDDELDLLHAMAEQLGASGYEILSAKDGHEALSLMQVHGSRVVGVVSDLNMPGMDGLTLRETCLQKFKAVPFIVLSGNVTRALALRALELKIAAFLDKPFDRHTILEVIARETADRAAALLEEDSLLEGFSAEASALLEEIETLCLQLEDQGASPEVLNRIFACAHTIKGASGYFKPDYVQKFAHKFEDYLVKFKNGSAVFSPQNASACLAAVDKLRGLIAELSADAPAEHDLEQLCAVFAADRGVEVKGPANLPGKSSDVRVQIGLLDSFMEKSGEITVLRSMINKALQSIEREFPGNANIANLSDLVAEMHRGNSLMQDRISDLRKVPLRQVMRPLQRTLRDLSVTLKKEIAFATAGEEIRIDYSLAEGLSKCLIHMLRNAADHGIENPEVRLKAGKLPSGTITLQCEDKKDAIELRLSDDGSGIDAGRIRAKAVEKGVLSAQEAAALTPLEARMLIFHPGFSTAEKVTDVSGRGVGMDMVRTTIEELGGRIEIESEAGKGTTFILVIPSPKSVVIIPSLLVRSGSHTFALPQQCVRRILRAPVGFNKIKTIKDRACLDDGEGLLPILVLREILDLSSGPPVDEINLVILRGKRSEYCLQVDEIQDIEDTVVKPIGGWFKDLPAYMGATLIADGKVAMILDVEGIAAKEGLNSSKAPSAHGTEDHGAAGARAFERFLLIESGGNCFAIPQKDIYRLERLENASRTGHRRQLVYRDRVLPLFEFRELLNIAGESRASYMLVIRRTHDFVGILVENIRDLVEVPAESPSLEAGSGTVRVVQGKSVTVVNFAKILPEAKETQDSMGAACAS